MKQPNDDEFTTFYFADGFETLVPLMAFIEAKFGVTCGLGSNFLNVYTERPELVQRVERAIREWSIEAPHVQLDRVEHPQTEGGTK